MSVSMKLDLILRATAEDAYRQFCDTTLTRLWLPGLKALKVVRTGPQGRAVEVRYSVGQSLTYALVYAYDDEAKRVRWVPSSGAQDGVSGFAAFEPHADGCVFSYSIDSRRGRQPLHAEEVAHAFGEWMESRRKSKSSG
jgi:hypothetical protein